MAFTSMRPRTCRRLPQILLVMKLTAMLVCLAVFQGVAKDSPGQEVSLQLKNAPLKKVFKEIKRQTGYYFLYSVELLEKANRVNLTLEKVPLQNALDKCLKNTPLTYAIVEKTVVIKQKPEEVEGNVYQLRRSKSPRLPLPAKCWMKTVHHWKMFRCN